MCGQKPFEGTTQCFYQRAAQCERQLVKMLAASSIFKMITDSGAQLGLPAGVFGCSGEALPLDGTHEHSGTGCSDAYLSVH